MALFSTGPEILPVDSFAYPGSIFNINSHTLRAALRLDGCDVVDLGIVPDDLDPLKAALTKGLAEADFVLLSGGSSLGGGDLVVEAFEAVGRVFIHGVAVKPPATPSTSGFPRLHGDSVNEDAPRRPRMPLPPSLRPQDWSLPKATRSRPPLNPW